MNSHEPLLFRLLAARPEEEIDLAEGALLIAEPEYPDLDFAWYRARLEDLGSQARCHLAAAPPDEAVGRLLHFFYRELGFRGNAEDYYDPRNSFLNEVLDRRTGLPITLAVVLIEVCRRVGVEAEGVRFPGHFLARLASPRGPLLVDPFDGRILDAADLRALAGRLLGQERDPDPGWLEPATKKQILARMLSNLRGIYAARSDHVRLRGVLERLEALAPSAEIRRELVALGGGATWSVPSPRTVH